MQFLFNHDWQIVQQNFHVLLDINWDSIGGFSLLSFRTIITRSTAVVEGHAGPIMLHADGTLWLFWTKHGTWCIMGNLYSHIQCFQATICQIISTHFFPLKFSELVYCHLANHLRLFEVSSCTLMSSPYCRLLRYILSFIDLWWFTSSSYCADLLHPAPVARINVSRNVLRPFYSILSCNIPVERMTYLVLFSSATWRPIESTGYSWGASQAFCSTHSFPCFPCLDFIVLFYDPLVSLVFVSSICGFCWRHRCRSVDWNVIWDFAFIFCNCCQRNFD